MRTVLAAGAIVTVTLAAAAQVRTDLCRVTGRTAALPELREASGVAVSRRTPGLLWAHNDSGEPVVYALDAAGSVKARVRVAGAGVVDWEDIAVGRCPSGTCLFVADIGDNNARRRNITIYRMPEPGVSDSVTKPADVFNAVYPDGPHDAEALFTTPAGDLYIVSKSKAAARIYRFPATAKSGATVTLAPAGVLQLVRGEDGSVTGAAASPDGRWVALRTNDWLLFWPTAELTGGRAGGGMRVDLRLLREPQGEGVSFGSDGVVFLVGEGRGTAGTMVRLSCTLPR